MDTIICINKCWVIAPTPLKIVFGLITPINFLIIIYHLIFRHKDNKLVS